MSKPNNNNQANLQQSPEDFKQMVESIQDYAIFRLDLEGRVTSWNRGAEQLQGYKAEEIIGQHFSAFYPPADVAEDRPGQILAAAKQSGRYEEEEWRIRKDGSEFRANVIITALFDDNKQLQGFSEISRNVTERRKIEEVLRESQDQLAKQAAELATVVEISRAISTILEPQLMLQTVVDLTKERFGLYHAHIYLLNETTGFLTLVAGAGEIGRKMVSEGRTIAFDQAQSLVARAARTRQSIIVNNVRTDPGFLPHPLLPETRSEMVIPLLIGDKVLGVLDIQANEINHFKTGEARIEVTLAAQIAVALQNARSFEQAEQSVNEFNALARRLTREGWDHYLDLTPAELAYHYNLQQVTPIAPSVLENAASSDGDQSQIEKALTVQGEKIGHVALTDPTTFATEAPEIVDAVAHHLSNHLENLRLAEQMERTLAEIETLYNASTEVIRARTIEDTLLALVYNSAFQRFDRVTLLFFNKPWINERPELMAPAAMWERENEHPHIAPGTQYPLEQFPVIGLFSPDAPTILTDIATDERTDGNTRHLLVEELGMHSLVVFPLIVSGQWLGVITGQGYTTLMLSEAEIRQLKSLTDQAATVIQTQRLFEQTQQNLNSIARLFNAGRRLNAADTLQAALAAVIESIPLPAINRALLLMLDRDEINEVTAAVVTANWYSGVGTPPSPLNTRYPWQTISTFKFILTTEPLFFNDIYTDPRIDSFVLQLLERQNIRALAALPLWVGSQQVGMLLLESEDTHYFTSEEIEPYTALAGQLAIAIDRQNLLEQTRTALSEAQILYKTTQELVVARSLDEVLQTIALAEIVPGVAGITLSTIELDELGQPDWSTISASWSVDATGPATAAPVGTRFRLKDFPLARLWTSQPDKVLLIGDISRHETIDASLEQTLRQSNIAAMGLIPLMVRGEWIGLISITWFVPQTFTERHQRLFDSLALQAAVTVNSQLLLERTQGALKEQERLTADLDNQRSTLQAVLQSIPAGVFVAEAPTGRPLLSNRQAQEMLGPGIAPDAQADEPAQVYPAYRYGTGELYPPAEMPLVRGMHGEVTSIGDMEIHRPDGSRIILQVFGAPIRDASGQITASVAIFQDVTEREQAEAEREQLLEEVQAAYRQFIQREWTQFLGGGREGKLQVEHQQAGVTLEGNGHLKRLEDEVVHAGKLKAISAANEAESSSKAAIVAPISLRGQVIGTLSLQDIDPNRNWTGEELALVETVSEQLAQTVENLRLFEETQKRASREQLTREITDKMRALPDMNSIIQTGLTELAKALRVPRTYVKLTSKPEPVEDTSPEIDAIRAQLKQHGHR